jgi:hypothetical protein
MNALIKFLVVCATTILLFACGGGSESLSRDGGGGGTTPDPDPEPTYSVAVGIADSQGNASNVVGEGSPLVITATLTATDGGKVSDVLVTFSLSSENLATFNNDTKTALTNSDGVAVIGIEVGSERGDGVVSATIDAGASGTVGFSSTGIQQDQVIPASLELFATQVQMASSGDDKVELIAVVKNEQNVLLEGVVVSFSADAGASIENVAGTTGPDGKATATLTTENNSSNRNITATATTSSLTDIVTVKVVGTKININGASSIILGDSAPITINLVDSSGVGIAGQSLALDTNVGALLDPTDPNSPDLQALSVTTDANGQVTVTFKATSSGNGEIMATVVDPTNSLNLTDKRYPMTVQQDDFSFSSLPEEDVRLDESPNISVRWFKNGTAFVGGTVSFTSSRGVITPSTVTTDASGIATASISSDLAGPASISAIGTDADDSTDDNTVTARASIEFVAFDVDSIFVDATPDLIGPDGQTSTISAVVRDAAGNLVKDQDVDFTLFDSNGGSIEPNRAKTGSDGKATTVYTSNAVSPQRGVEVIATADTIQGSVFLTVGDRAFDISIGTGNEIIDQDSSTYIKEFAVFVSDSVGRPVENVSLTASATPVKYSTNDSISGKYGKGYWVWFEDAGRYLQNGINSDASFVSPIECNNEDQNGNGRLDIVPIDEDENNDGELTPGIIGTISFKEGVSTTNASGQATLELRYPKQYANWVGVEVAVFGQSSGSEARDSQILTLPIANADVTNKANKPAENPFGEAQDCTVAN